MILFAAATGLRAGPPVNFDFEDGLTGWMTDGEVTVQQALSGNHVAMLRETNGGLSRIYQDFTLSGSIDWLTFQCRLASPPPVSGPWPPDSITVYLTDTTTGTRMVGTGLPPDFSDALIYQDSHMMSLASEPYAFVDSAPPNQLQMIRIDVREITNDRDVRLEFAFNHAENEIESFVVIDGLQLDCPPGYCCSPDLSVINPIDDGLDCTTDTCHSDTGEVTHESNGCCPQCSDSSANVVIMIDVTGSINDAELNHEKEAARSFLEAFQQADPRPYVVIGRFSTQVTDDAEIVEPSVWTTDYGDSGEGPGPATGLFAAIDNMDNPNGNTHIAAAIAVARAKIQMAPEPDLRNYIVLISDGQANRPTGSTWNDPCEYDPAMDCFSGCGISKRGWCLADQEARLAETEDDISIIAVFFDGGGGCAHDCGEYFMSRAIATLPPGQNPDDNPFFVDEPADLVCAFNDIVQTISCDDGDPCTTDSCENGQCLHTPIVSPNCGGEP